MTGEAPTFVTRSADDWRNWTDDELARRQAALGVDFGGDRLNRNEVASLERFQSLAPDIPLREKIIWIPQLGSRAPLNDFYWLHNGHILIDLKTTGAKYSTIHDLIHRAVVASKRSLSPDAQIKENFIVDICSARLTPKLRGQLSKHNLRNPNNPLSRLWVLSRDGLEEIEFLKT